MQKRLLKLHDWGLRFLVPVLCSMLLFSACDKKSGDDDQTIPTSPEKFQQLTEAGFRSLIETKDFDASDTSFLFISRNGTRVHINGSCLRKNGQPLSGQVTLEFYEAFNTNDMLIANKATMGRNSGGELEPMKTGGQFYINVKQNGEPLSITCRIKVEAYTLLTGNFNDQMVAWDGFFTEGNLVWEPATTWMVTMGEQGRTYDMQFPGFGWFNCDKLYNDPRPKTPLTIQVPAAYADASVVYAIIRGEPHSLGLAAYGVWPVGIELYLIFVTEENGKYKWLSREITVTNGHTESFDPNQGTIGTKAELTTFLNTLD